ncbi:MAG TPA: hypothetical protein DEP84_25725 [Chloroflexi bacterium]|nr:hypothetical protein [Chloroflexota bacterium]
MARLHTMTRSPISNLQSLWILGAASLALYAATFVLPFPLWRWVDRAPALSWAELAHYRPAAGVGLALAWVALFGLYWQAVLVAQAQLWSAVRAPVITWTVLSGLLLAVGAYPGGAIDIYTYVAHTRLFLAGLNPFLVPPDTAAATANLAPFLGEWHALTSPYGPLWELLALGAGWLGRGGLWQEVVAFKLWNLAALLALLAPLSAALRTRVPRYQAAGCVLVAWNPLLLVEVAANGHNDSWMLLAFTGAIWAWAGRRWWALLPLLVAGAAMKWVPAIVAPLFLGDQLRVPRGRRVLPLGVLLATGVLLASLLPFWTAAGDLRRWAISSESERVGFSWQALFLLAADWIRPGRGVPPSLFELTRLAGYSLFGLAFLYSGRRLAQHRWSLPVAGFWVLVTYLSLGAPAFRPWYTLWVLPPAALAIEGRLSQRAAGLTLGTALATVLYGFAWPWLGAHAALWLHLVGVPLSLGGAWLPDRIIAAARGRANFPANDLFGEPPADSV